MRYKLPLSKVANINDFSSFDLQSTVEFYFPHYSNKVLGDNLNSQFCNRKAWEIFMAIYSFDRFKLLGKDKEFLGIGAAKEETISILSQHVKRVFATDIYLDQGVWSEWHDRQMLINPRSQMDSNYYHQRVVWQHVDGRELPYEDNSFDGIFSCSSIEHFGNEEEIRQALEEAHRVLKPGGVAAISSEYKIEGDGDGFDHVQLFDKERLQRVWLDGIGWEAQDFLDDKLDDTEFVDFERSIFDSAYRDNLHYNIKLDNNKYKWTSVHLTLVKQ